MLALAELLLAECSTTSEEGVTNIRHLHVKSIRPRESMKLSVAEHDQDSQHLFVSKARTSPPPKQTLLVLKMFLPFIKARQGESHGTGRGPRIPAIGLDVSLELAGLVALAEITVVDKWTALSGGANFLDSLVLCPGLHRQHHCTNLNGGEYPATAALTTGYVFRVENQGTVYYLQRMARTGQLTTLKVRKLLSTDDDREQSAIRRWLSFQWSHLSPWSLIAYSLCVLLTVLMFILMGVSEDWWGIFVLGILVLCRAIITIFIARRSNPKWFGAREPGVYGDLIILLSQDRWVRLRGAVDDLKAVTSGQWLRDLGKFESFMVSFANVLVYVDAALASNLKTLGKILLIVLLVGTAGLLDVAADGTNKMVMHGRVIELDGERRTYERRLQLAEELIKESKRHDWAIKTGMINQSDLEQMDSRTQPYPGNNPPTEDANPDPNTKGKQAVLNVQEDTIAKHSRASSVNDLGKVTM